MLYDLNRFDQILAGHDIDRLQLPQGGFMLLNRIDGPGGLQVGQQTQGHHIRRCSESNPASSPSQGRGRPMTIGSQCCTT